MTPRSSLLLPWRHFRAVEAHSAGGEKRETGGEGTRPRAQQPRAERTTGPGEDAGVLCLSSLPGLWTLPGARRGSPGDTGFPWPVPWTSATRSPGRGSAAQDARPVDFPGLTGGPRQSEAGHSWTGTRRGDCLVKSRRRRRKGPERWREPAFPGASGLHRPHGVRPPPEGRGCAG